MNFILDACTAIHLLQTDIKDGEEASLNIDFFNKFSKADFKIIILPKVLEEINDNIYKNLDTTQDKEFVKKYISKNFYNFLESSGEYKEVISFIRDNKSYNDDNGELHCTAYALYYSRYIQDSVFQTLLFTDDDGAIEDFDNFFKINSIGSILTTTDLLNILFRKGLIKKQDVISFLINLKKLYLSELNSIAQLIENANFTSDSKKNVESSLLTKIKELLDSTNFDAVGVLIDTSKPYQNFKRKNQKLDELLRKITTTDYKKIHLLEEKLNQLRNHLWEI